MDKMNFHSLDIPQMMTLATQAAKCLAPGVSICLWGDLGAGKTTFARMILKTLDPSIKEVPSPTFTLVQQYVTAVGDVWHCDFYRLIHAEEIFELGIEEAFYHDICLIEWPEKIQPYLPENRLDIFFTISDDSNLTRDISIINTGIVDVRFSL